MYTVEEFLKAFKKSDMFTINGDVCSYLLHFISFWFSVKVNRFKYSKLLIPRFSLWRFIKNIPFLMLSGMFLFLLTTVLELTVRMINPQNAIIFNSTIRILTNMYYNESRTFI